MHKSFISRSIEYDDDIKDIRVETDKSMEIEKSLFNWCSYRSIFIWSNERISDEIQQTYSYYQENMPSCPLSRSSMQSLKGKVMNPRIKSNNH